MKIWWIPVLVLTVAVGGCSGGKKDAKEATPANEQVSAQPPPAQHAEVPPPIEEKKPVEVVKPVESTPKPKTTPSGPTTKLVALPSGYAFQVVLDETISTETHQAGRAFQAKLVQPAVLKTEGEVIPVGSRIRGEVTFAQRAGRVGGKAEMTLEYRELTTPDGKTYPLFADPLTLEGKSTTKGDVEKTVGGAVGGAILGGILGGKSGAVKGGAAGGAAGAAWAIATRGNDIVIDPGQVLQVTLSRTLRVTATVPAGSAIP